jgi:hypothetical protein
MQQQRHLCSSFDRFRLQRSTRALQQRSFSDSSNSAVRLRLARLTATTAQCASSATATSSAAANSSSSFSFQPPVLVTATTMKSMARHDDILLVLCWCGSIQPQRLATFAWYLQYKSQRQQKQHVCDNLCCSVSSMAATSVLASALFIDSSAASTFSNRDRTCFCSRVIQPCAGLSAPALSSNERFSSNIHLCHSSTTSAMRLDCISASAFDLLLCSSNIAQQQLQRFSASATGGACAAATQQRSISASAACSSSSDVVACRISNIISISTLVFSFNAVQQHQQLILRLPRQRYAAATTTYSSASMTALLCNSDKAYLSLIDIQRQRYVLQLLQQLLDLQPTATSP